MDRSSQLSNSSRSIPELSRLHERHPGLTKPVAETYAEAARVLLDQFHQPPVHANVGLHNRPRATYLLEWEPPRPDSAGHTETKKTRHATAPIRLCWPPLKSTLISLATTRLKTGTGADYLLEPKGIIQTDTDELNLESAIRLEVSGIRRCDSAAVLARRLHQKVEQARRGRSSAPCYPRGSRHSASPRSASDTPEMSLSAHREAEYLMSQRRDRHAAGPTRRSPESLPRRS